MTIRDFFSVLRVRWMIVVASLLVVVGATAGATLLQSPVYEAAAKVYLSTTRPATANQAAGTYAITQSDLNTYVEVLGSPSVMEPLREKLGLPPGTPIDVNAVVSESSNVLLFRARSSNPQLAAQIANESGPVLASAAQKFSPLLALSGQTVEATAISPAGVPGAPISPNVRKNLALGALAGLALGIGLALLRHVVDTKVRSDEDIRKLSDRPILGHLPAIKGPEHLSVEDEPHGHHAESIRRLRTNLLFVDVTTQSHSFVVTSAGPGEGKTTTAANLALALADAGTRTLLVDGDLRNPSVAKVMGIEGSVGLTTILLGRATPGEVIQQWRGTNLHVLPAGQIPPNPSELLGSEAMSQLFQKLSQDFDFILVDSAPINPVIDAVLINKLTRGMIMIVASDRTHRRDLEHALTSLSTIDVEVSGFALNMVAANNSAAYRYGSYSYGHTAALHGTHGRRSQRPKSKRGVRQRAGRQ